MHTIRCVCTREKSIYVSNTHTRQPHTLRVEERTRKEKKMPFDDAFVKPKKPHTIKCPKSFILLSHKYSRMTNKIAPTGWQRATEWVSEEEHEKRISTNVEETHILFSTLGCLHLYIFISTTLTHDIHIMVFRYMYEFVSYALVRCRVRHNVILRHKK